MRSYTRNLTTLVLGVVLGSILLFGHAAWGANSGQQKQTNDSIPVEQLRNFVEILNRIKRHYVEPVSDKQLIKYAIRGMLGGLDPHSAYLSPQQFKNLSASTSGQFGGLGIVVTMDNDFVRVVSPIDGTPAKRAGIQSGDLIIRINDTAVKGMSLMDAVKRMRGEPGTEIHLTVLRESKNEPFKVTIERAIVEVESVKARRLKPDYGYIRISQFSKRTDQALREQVKQLLEQSGGQLKGLVLDLRNNPGGVLSSAVHVADAFMHDGTIVSIKGRGDNDKVYKANRGDMLKGSPIVVLINGGSASASEIVAGALQDSDRAIIMGQKTFGKGSVQSVIPLKSEAALKLTVARYYTPSGRSIQAKGITPDIKIQDVKISATENKTVMPFSESDLIGALDNKQDSEQNKKAQKTSKTGSQAPYDKPLALRDYMLYEALNLLQGLHIVRNQQNG